MGQGNPEIEQVSARLGNIESGIDKLLDLYQSGFIGKDMLAKKVTPMNEHRKLVGETLEQLTDAQDIVNVPGKEILLAITTLTDEIRHADPKIVKSAVPAMFDEIVVNPKRRRRRENTKCQGELSPPNTSKLGDPKGNRTPVFGVRGRRPDR